MSDVTENVVLETEASDTPEVEVKAADKPFTEDKPEAEIKGENISCCGSCS